MTSFFDCSYARAAVKFYTEKNSFPNGVMTAVQRSKRYALFTEQFRFTEVEEAADAPLCDFEVAFENFDRAAKRLLEAYNRRWPGGGNVRQTWRARFSPESWKRLSRVEQLSHKRTDCQECASAFPDLHGAFPTGKRRAELDTSPEVENIREEIKEHQEKQRDKAAAVAAQKLLVSVEKTYKETFPGK